MPFGREILLRNVKYAFRRVDFLILGESNPERAAKKV